MDLLARVETYLRRTHVPPSRFGREAVGDPNFVSDLRRGRQPGGEVAERVLGFLHRAEKGSRRPACKA
jgi:hypothetical protein